MFSSLQKIVNKLLPLVPDAPLLLPLLEGKRVHITVTDMPLFYALYFNGYKINISTEETGCSDISIKGPTIALLSLALRKDRRRALELGLTIEGDLESAQILESLFLNLTLDWEEGLARFTNDVFAYQVGNFFRGFKKRQQDLTSTLTKDSALYLTQEIKILPAPEEIENWLDAVDTLRADIERAEARIKYLAQNMAIVKRQALL
jgi:ubiquinone biosynthesis protein UbiJ